MSSMTNRYFIQVVALLAVAAAFFWWINSKDGDVSQERALQWIQEGYPAQFCTNIYPKLADCLTLTVNECESIAEKQVQPCLDQIIDKMPQSMTAAESKQYYSEAGGCFQKNMNAHLSSYYLVDTPECKQRMQ